MTNHEAHRQPRFDPLQGSLRAPSTSRLVRARSPAPPTSIRGPGASASSARAGLPYPRAILLPGVARGRMWYCALPAESACRPTHRSAGCGDGSCGNTSAEAREHLARTRESACCQAIKPAARTASTGWVDGFPATVEPTGRFKPQKNGIQRSRGQAAALLHVRAGELFGRILEEGVQYPQRLERHAHVAIPPTHDRKST